MTVLVTGAAGFIGYHVCQALLARGTTVVGIDDLNDYYDVSLKEARLERLASWSGFTFLRLSVADSESLTSVFQGGGIDKVIHLAAQAGVRYSLTNAPAYGESNLVGFLNVLEACRHYDVRHLVYASSSSVYGANGRMPFSEKDNVDHPVSLYAATKKANESMAHSYSHLYGLPTTGLRFFTVYGPWGRPDMSPMLFADAILSGRPLKVFNYGKHRRDFTYIDDIVDGIIKALDNPPSGNSEWSPQMPDPSSSLAPWRIYNIGNGEPVELLYYISLLEKAFGRTAEKELLPMQPGDVESTYADIGALERDTGYQPRTSIEQGVEHFAAWYMDYYGEKK